MYQYITKTVLLNNKLNFYFNFIYGFIWINIKSRFFCIKLPSIYYYKNDSIIVLKKFYYITFLKHLFNFYNNLFCFYYYKLKLKGLGYRVYNISKKLIKIFFNRSNFFYLHIPSSVMLKYRTRRFFFLSTHYNTLKVMILHLLFLKEFVIYRQNGIYYTRQIILIKPGKNKFR